MGIVDVDACGEAIKSLSLEIPRLSQTNHIGMTGPPSGTQKDRFGTTSLRLISDHRGVDLRIRTA